MIIVIALLLLFAIFYKLFNNQIEGIDELTRHSSRGINVETGSNLLDDKLFQNVIVYNNVIEGNHVKELGLMRCVNRCSGKCVEFGNMGLGLCFEDEKSQPLNIDRALKNNVYTHEDIYKETVI